MKKKDIYSKKSTNERKNKEKLKADNEEAEGKLKIREIKRY